MQSKMILRTRSSVLLGVCLLGAACGALACSEDAAAPAGTGGATSTSGGSGGWASGGAGVSGTGAGPSAGGSAGALGSGGTAAGGVGAGGASGASGSGGLGTAGSGGSAGQDTGGSGGEDHAGGAGGAAAHGKFVGNITTSGQLRSDFATYWTQLTPENEGKWEAMEPRRDEMNWAAMDGYYAWTRQHGIPLKAHTFVWGSQQPRWIDGISAAEQADEVEEWIRSFCERYPEIELIDVVNEPDHATPSFIEALGGRGSTGHDWVIWSFEKARQHCPHSILILNDYNVLRWDTDNFISIANKVKARGLLDAVGAQAHGLETQALSELQANLAKVAGIGVPIYVSEYDINEADDARQLAIMSEQFPVFWESPQVAGITLWGYVHGATWRAHTGLLRSGTPRPALTWLMNYLDR